MKTKLILVCIYMSGSVAAHAQQGPGSPSQPGQQNGQRRGPPPEALAACQGKSAGAACSFNCPPPHQDQQVSGTCFTPGGDKPLACRPSHGPGGQEGHGGQGDFQHE